MDKKFITDELHDLDKSFLVATIIGELPYSWSNHANELNHNQGVLTLKYVLRPVGIEERETGLGIANLMSYQHKPT